MSRPRVCLLVVAAGLVGLLAAVPPAGRSPIALAPGAGEELPDRAVARLVREPYAGPVAEVRYSPDGRYLAALTKKGGLDLWDVRTRMVVRNIADVNDYLSPNDSFAFSPDGTLLAIARGIGEHYRRTGEVVLREVPSGRVRRVYPLTHAATFIRFAADGRRLFLAYFNDPQVHTLDLANGAVAPLFDRTAIGARVNPSEIDFSERTMALGIASSGEKPVLFDCRAKKPGVVLPVEQPNNAAVRLSPDGTVLATMGGAPLLPGPGRGAAARSADVVGR